MTLLRSLYKYLDNLVIESASQESNHNNF